MYFKFISRTVNCPAIEIRKLIYIFLLFSVFLRNQTFLSHRRIEKTKIGNRKHEVEIAEFIVQKTKMEADCLEKKSK